ncbi:ParB/RepB/Spo0J family partition protein [Herbaspirillum frisingense]|uniref:ParB/RepB/Spo0J family partition protein n=1 Tax=Herbaspirillum frisingense TaxID=92645 RepID=UPI0039AFFA5B
MSIDLTHPHFGMIPIEYIVADPNQPRKTFDEDALAELSESIKQSGILQPILTRPVAGSHTDVEIVAGERRYRAAKLAGLTEVPAIVREISDAEVAIMQLVENHQRADVAPIEEAEKMRKAMDDYGFSIEELCEKMGVKRRWAYTRLQLLRLAPEARAALTEGKVNASTALLVARIPVPALQEKAMSEILANNGHDGTMSHRAAQELLATRYMLSLDEAPFDPADAKLVKGCGSCQECPKRAGNQPDVFTDVDANTCTDPDCFETKKQTHFKIIITKAEKKKIPIFSDWKELRVQFPYGTTLNGSERLWGLQRLVNHAEMSSKSILEALSISQLPKPAAYLVEHDGKPVPEYLKTEIQQALEKAGIARTEEQQTEYEAELEKAADAESDGSGAGAFTPPKKRAEEVIAAAYDKYHQSVFSAIRDQLQPIHTAAVYRAMAARIAVAGSTGGFYIEISSDVDETYDADLTQHAEVDHMLEQATDEDVCRLFIEGLLEPGRVWSTEIVDGEFKPDEDDADAISLNATLFKVARIVGVDTSELKREAFRDIEPEPTRALAPDAAWPFPKSKE